MQPSSPILVPLGSFPADWRQLRPTRFDRAKVLERVRGMDDVVAAWRVLAIPRDPDRVFRLVADQARGPDWIDASQPAKNCDGGPSGLYRCSVLDRIHPHTFEEAIAFAADADCIAIVERWARTYAEATTPWRSTPSPRRIAWRFLRRDASIPALPGRTKEQSLILDCLEQAFERVGAPVKYAGGEMMARPADLWRDACARGLRVPAELEDPYFVNGALGAPFVPAAARDQRFAELPDPYEPLERIAMLGYAVETVDEGAITLLAAPP